jgi:STE24 endopeptidase
VTGPIAAALSRQAEAAADRYALETTDNPEAFAAAMRRLADQNLAVYDPPRWVEVLLYDHPALVRRVGAAEQYASEQSGKS